jgi:hypothetical protein
MQYEDYNDDDDYYDPSDWLDDVVPKSKGYVPKGKAREV